MQGPSAPPECLPAKDLDGSAKPGRTRHRQCRRQPRWWTICWLVIGCLAMSTAAAVAQEPASGFGRFQALSSTRTLPPGSTIDVDVVARTALFPGDRLDAAAAEATQAALTAQGFRVVDRGQMVLRVRVTQAPAGDVRARPDRLGPRADSIPRERSPIPRGDRVPEIVDPLRVPLGPPTFRVDSFYSLNFTLFERGREPIWSATIEASGRIPDPERLVRTLARTALADLGHSVEREFTLVCADDQPGTICLD